MLDRYSISVVEKQHQWVPYFRSFADVPDHLEASLIPDVLTEQKPNMTGNV